MQTLTQNGHRVQNVVAAGRPANTIHALIEAVVRTRRAVDHLITHQKVGSRFVRPTVQRTFFCR